MRCKRCNRKLTEKNYAYTCGFGGYCRKCELAICKAEGLPDSFFCLGEIKPRKKKKTKRKNK